MDVDQLTPRQEEIRDGLLAVGQTRPEFDRGLGRHLREELRATLFEMTESLPSGHTVWVNKHRLSQVHSCEGYLVAKDTEPFEWRVSNARGRVIHRAIESMLMNRYRKAPLVLAESAVDELSGIDDDLGRFLRDMSGGERQDLLRDVNDVLIKFVADWPRIDESWFPRVESEARFGFGKVKLRAVFDLALGIPSGSTARTIIVDFKTGKDHPSHIQDLRFYALGETLRAGTPPYRVANYYLDSGTWYQEDVTVELLDVARRQVVDGIRKIIKVETGVAPSLTAGPVCRYCPSRLTCPVSIEAGLAIEGG